MVDWTAPLLFQKKFIIKWSTHLSSACLTFFYILVHRLVDIYGPGFSAHGHTFR